ncbi:MAG: hypothetical protein FWF98_04140 [Dehalococcoidia bacterium]|nr:hypothetical protein [Dehalococcoidia bacterium]
MSTRTKAKGKILSIFLPLLLVAGLAFTGIFAGNYPLSAANGVWAGNGTEQSPYLISDTADLSKLAADVNGGKGYANTYFELTADIDLANYNSGGGWTPIGNIAHSFYGNFNGDGHIIHNLTINRATSNDEVGLFGCIDNSTIMNLGIENSVVIGNSDVGGVVGLSYISTVLNCYNTGKVSGNAAVGGVVGFNENSIVENCYNTGSVSGTNAVGGVVGNNFGGTINNCYNSGAITGIGSFAGGVAGINYAGTATNCYNTGALTGVEIVGGVVGGHVGYYVISRPGIEEHKSITENCYSTGVIAGISQVGGVSGYNSISSPR